MADRTNAERQARFRERMRASGYVQVIEWVPADRADELRSFAAKMRETFREPCTETNTESACAP